MEELQAQLEEAAARIDFLEQAVEKLASAVDALTDNAAIREIVEEARALVR
jgi:Tfp pilus assembly protein FimV